MRGNKNPSRRAVPFEVVLHDVQEKIDIVDSKNEICHNEEKADPVYPVMIGTRIL